MKYILDRDYANELMEWAYHQNPGPWYNHSINVARATENILGELNNKGFNLDVDLGYNAALLHDIGRYKGFTKSVIHSYDGYIYLKELGFTGNAVVCVTHSFPNGNEHIEIAADWNLVPKHMKIKLIDVLNENSTYDIYNKVITLCDALADPDGFTILETKQANVLTFGVQWLPNYQTAEFSVHPIRKLSNINEFKQSLKDYYYKQQCKNLNQGCHWAAFSYCANGQVS